MLRLAASFPYSLRLGAVHCRTTISRSLRGWYFDIILCSTFSGVQLPSFALLNAFNHPHSLQQGVGKDTLCPFYSLVGQNRQRSRRVAGAACV